MARSKDQIFTRDIPRVSIGLGLAIKDPPGFRRPPIFAAGVCALISVWLLAQPLGFAACLGKRILIQAQVVSIGILSFQVEPGVNAPSDVGQKIAQDLQRKLGVTFMDLAPRSIGAGADASAIKTLSVDQVASLAKQNGLKFAVRGGLLALTTEQVGEGTKVSVQLYADIISVDASVNSVRADGVGMQKGKASNLSARQASLDFGTGEFTKSALGQALSSSIEQLAASIHQAISSQTPQAPASDRQPQNPTDANPNNQADSTQTQSAMAAESDEELQQLIAQAESTLSGSASASTENVNSLRQALEGLKSALASKAGIMEHGLDSAQADQEVARRKEELQAAVTRVTQDVTSGNTSTSDPEQSSSEKTAGVPQPTGEKKDRLAQISEFAAQALDLMGKIQELRAAFRSVKEDASASSPNFPPSQGTEFPRDVNTQGNTPGQDITSPQDAKSQDGAPSQGAVNQPGPPSEEPTAEVSGAVTENGRPVQGAVVTDQESGASATTDSNGSYALKGVLGGELARLTLTQAGKQVADGRVEVLPGRPTVADFQLKPAPIGATAAPLRILPSTVVVARTLGDRAGTVKGTVQDAQGKPVPRALVTLKGLAVARTDSLGQYVFLNSPPGDHELIVFKTGLRTKSERVRVAADKSTESRVLFLPNDRIVETQKKGILLHAGTGSVLLGIVLDANKHAVVGAKVSVIQSEAAVSVLTGPKGDYGIRNLKPGSYRVSVSKLGFDSSNQSILLANGTERRDFQLKRNTSPLIETLVKNELAKQGQIRGQVRESSHRPISNATVEILAPGNPLVIAKTVTDANGEYILRLHEGSYELKVRQSSFQEESRKLSVQAGGSMRADFDLKQIGSQPVDHPRPPGGISISGGKSGQPRGQAVDDTRPALEKRGQLTGRVTEATSRKPISGATVSVQGQQSVKTDRDGYYTVINLAAGTYKIKVSLPGFTGEEKSIAIGAGSSRQDFALRTESAVKMPTGTGGTTAQAKNGQLTGRVIDANGKPIPGAVVLIAGPRSAVTNQEGNYAMSNLPPGSYRVTVKRSGFSDDEKAVTIRSGENATLNFRLSAKPVVLKR